MSNIWIPEPDDYLTCPYDDTHQIMARRMPYHLMKCQKNYRGKAMAECPFNAKHRVPKPELRYHMAFCPDRAILEADLAYDKQRENIEDLPRFQGCTDIPSSNWISSSSTLDSWDDEIEQVEASGIKMRPFRLGAKSEMIGTVPSEDIDKPLRQPFSMSRNLNADTTFSDEPIASVYNYSLGKMGIGRGKPRPTSLNNEASSNEMPLGRGRGSMFQMLEKKQSNEKPGFTVSSPYYSASTIASKYTLATQENGVGRGVPVRLAKEPAFIVPQVVSTASRNTSDNLATKSAVVSAVGKNGCASESQDEYSNVMSCFSDGSGEDLADKEAVNKKIKQISKKLRQIKNLEGIQETGKKLSAEEEIKVKRKDELINDLERLKYLTKDPLQAQMWWRYYYLTPRSLQLKTRAIMEEGSRNTSPLPPKHLTTKRLAEAFSYDHLQ